jgi:hypothetical protein
MKFGMLEQAFGCCYQYGHIYWLLHVHAIPQGRTKVGHGYGDERNIAFIHAFANFGAIAARILRRHPMDLQEGVLPTSGGGSNL